MADKNSAPAVFNLDPKGAGTLKLQAVVQEKLLTFLEADYTDKVLAEYIVVLVAHGKSQSQAAGELEAFLGSERAESFTKWLWDHVSANLSAYAEANHDDDQDGSPRQSDASSESEASEDPKVGDDEQPEPVHKGPDRPNREEEERGQQRSNDRRARLDEETDRRGAWVPRGADDGRSDDYRRGRQSGERYSERRAEERRRSSPPRRLEREERRGRHERHSREDWHRERRGRGFEEEERAERDSRYREHHRPERQLPPPPPPRGEPFLEERRGDWGRGRREEQRPPMAMEEGARGHGQDSRRMEGEGLSQKRARERAHGDLDAPVLPDEPPPPPRSRPRLAGIPDYARMMGIALKAVAEAADEAAQAARAGPAPPPAPIAAPRVTGGDVWKRLGADSQPESSRREETVEHEPPAPLSRTREQPGQDAKRSRLNSKLRERLSRAADVTRKVVRAGPAGPSVTVTFGDKKRGLRRRQVEAEAQPRQEVGAVDRAEGHGMERVGRGLEEARGTESEQEFGEEQDAEEGLPAEAEWQEAEAMEEQAGVAPAEEVEEEPVASADVDVAEMKRRMRAVQLEMTKLRAKQGEAERTKGPTPPGPKPAAKPPTPQQLDARTVVASNVHFAATKEVLAAHFGQAGTVTDVRILLDPATGRPRGCAFITFDSEETAEQALTLDQTSVLSRQLKVAPKSSALAVLKSLPTFVPRPLPAAPIVRVPRPPFRRAGPVRGSTKWVRPGAVLVPPAKSPKSPPIPQNLTWRRSASAEAQPAAATPGQAVNGAGQDGGTDNGGAREA